MDMVGCHWKCFYILMGLMLLSIVLIMDIINTEKSRIAYFLRISKKYKPQQECLEAERKKLILIWHVDDTRRNPSTFHHKRYTEGLQGCSCKNCEFTLQKTDLNKSDAVIIDMVPGFNISRDLPSYRPSPTQQWIFYRREPPSLLHPVQYSVFDNLINLTLTYRQDSDFPISEFIVRRRGKSDRPYVGKDYARNKSKLAAWFASHCYTQSKRQVFVEELLKHMDIDIYGDCGPLKCPKYEHACQELLRNKYKFYLSFENSICQDYVTEKFSRALSNDIVPVVLGGVAYTDYLPKSAFIDVADFSSPKALSEYLHFLDENDDKYNEYFSWKKEYIIERIRNVDYRACDICKHLNRKNKPKNVYSNFSKWWKHCTLPVDYYKGIDFGKLADGWI